MNDTPSSAKASEVVSQVEQSATALALEQLQKHYPLVIADDINLQALRLLLLITEFALVVRHDVGLVQLDQDGNALAGTPVRISLPQ